MDSIKKLETLNKRFPDLGHMHANAAWLKFKTGDNLYSKMKQLCNIITYTKLTIIYLTRWHHWIKELSA